MKIVKNDCFGGYGLSPKAMKLYAEKKGMTLYPLKRNGDSWTKSIIISWEEADTYTYYSTEKLKDDKTAVDGSFFCDDSIERTDPILIEVIETLGKDSWGQSAELIVVEIPDDVEWFIDEYDGAETIRENHRCW